ncbi:hypothetical protein [uncultured Sphingomonas sp.]|uniref:hypothetical protein n=1 Tax=uncultured Sphingomonas sp. TaxID=158754 RepID=UPI0025D3030E|nr:hypothetical protein [uncultured Sphingomonas sp.]
MIPLLLIALQAEPAVPMPPPAGGRFSILARDPCPASRGTAADIIVCGRRQADDRAPQLRDEPPTGPVPSNPELTGAGALAASSTPCPARQGGCQVGFDLVTPALMLANEVRIGISKLADKRRDKSRRIPIALDGPGPQGHLKP